jgi:hypothetical protein
MIAASNSNWSRWLQLTASVPEQLVLKYGFKFYHLILVLQNFIEQSSTSDCNSHLAGQESFSLSLNSKVHYRVNKSPRLVPIPRHVDPVHIFKTVSVQNYFVTCMGNYRRDLDQ